MRIRLGYVAISLAINKTASSLLTYTNFSLLDKEASFKKLDQVIKNNLASLLSIIEYNYKNNIHFYRLTSKLIPLATHNQVFFDYLTPYQDYYSNLAKLIIDNKMRIDSHPDQYTVLNSFDKKIVDQAIENINYHAKILTTLGITNPYIILHIGSGYPSKQEAIKRFINNYKRLSFQVQKMIAIENDDKIFNIIDTLQLAKLLHIPMVLDYHHYLCNNNGELIASYLKDILHTWKNTSLPPKIHFSSPKSRLKKEYRSHHDYITSTDFVAFLQLLKPYNIDVDIMLEAKQKDLALAKLILELKYLTNYTFIDETSFLI